MSSICRARAAGVFVLALSAACASSGPTGSGYVEVVPDAGGPDGSPPPGFGSSGGALDAGAPDGKPSAPNLVPNGDFTQGNTLFGSDYLFATANTAEGQYTVGASGQAFNRQLVNAREHTTGAGVMFIGNGKATPDRVWFTTSVVSVAPNTQYSFEAWVMNLCCSSGLGDGVHAVGPSVLSFYANDQLLGTRTSSKLGEWEGLSTRWSSGAASTVTLKLVNANTEAIGNDFAVDDIYLGTETSIPPPR